VAAVVVHHHGSGIGVMFRDPQPELFREAAQPRSPTAAEGWGHADGRPPIRVF